MIDIFFTFVFHNWVFFRSSRSSSSSYHHSSGLSPATAHQQSSLPRSSVSTTPHYERYSFNVGETILGHLQNCLVFPSQTAASGPGEPGRLVRVGHCPQQRGRRERRQGEVLLQGVLIFQRRRRGRRVLLQLCRGDGLSAGLHDGRVRPRHPHRPAADAAVADVERPRRKQRWKQQQQQRSRRAYFVRLQSSSAKREFSL